MQICHCSHEHPLALCMMEDTGEPCKGRSRPILDLGHVCHRCGFLLHKKCEKLPRKVLLRVHPKHPLTLQFSSETFKCGVCKKTGSGLTFQCGECKYNVDVTCFLTNFPCTDFPPQECKTRKLPRSTATLCLCAQQSKRKCTGCEQQISGSACCCKECDLLTLHKYCAQLPRQRENPCCLSHSRALLKETCAICDACRKINGGSVYHCDKCSFDLDLVCTCLAPSLKLEKCNDFPSCFKESRGQVSCNSCSTPCSNNLYRCVSCNFNVHCTCLPLPSTVKHKHHPHSLTLKEPTPKDDSSRICCAACKMKICPKDRAYYCAECCYGVHLECVVPEEQPDRGKLAEDIARVQEALNAIAAQL
ncbi:uncharacterized protein LOC120292986 isoform X1 [Eucalyptus grandis]|uniref:uncharacterized protein LOC120292986 isoform X1 n=1 Tax=Eucalyptus grandis TaxID=71139 RepID=UPI00192ED5F6|nr:uncharacterized protein LOC120292986 isoform X1 [Eucalyptus grandis]